MSIETACTPFAAGILRPIIFIAAKTEVGVNVRSLIVIFVIAVVPAFAQAQKPSAVTRADVQKITEIISGDKAKTQTYCDIAHLGDEIEQAGQKKDSKQAEALSQKVNELGKQLGAEYVALMDELQNIDPESEVGQDIASMFRTLDELCRG
jgi:hypothetical protein